MMEGVNKNINKQYIKNLKYYIKNNKLSFLFFKNLWNVEGWKINLTISLTENIKKITRKLSLKVK
jgi:hypothetical protein